MSLSFLFYVSARQIVRLHRHFGTYPLFTDPESFLHLKLKWHMYINKGLSHVFIKQNKRLSFLLLRRCSTLSILYCGIEYFEIYNKTSEFFDLSDNICADDISKDSLERILPFLLNTCTLNQTTLIAKIFL